MRHNQTVMSTGAAAYWMIFSSRMLTLRSTEATDGRAEGGKGAPGAAVPYNPYMYWSQPAYYQTR